MNVDYEGSRRQFFQLLAQHDAPAFVRRAQHVQATCDSLLAHCRKNRDDLLRFPRMRLAITGALVDHDWSILGKYLQDPHTSHYLAALHDQWKPRLQSRIANTNAPHKIRRALRELAASFVGFNRQWKGFLLDLDLTEVNKVRDSYNKYYVIEKACAFLSERIGQEGFQQLPPLTMTDIVQEFPYLRIPKLR